MKILYDIVETIYFDIECIMYVCFETDATGKMGIISIEIHNHEQRAQFYSLMQI